MNCAPHDQISEPVRSSRPTAFAAPSADVQHLNAFCGLRRGDGRLDAGGLSVTLLETGAKCRDSLTRHEIHGAAAESAPGHARSNVSRASFGGRYHRIELRTRYLVLVAKARMRFRHKRAHGRQVAPLEGSAGCHYARVLRHDVVAAPPLHAAGIGSKQYR